MADQFLNAEAVVKKLNVAFIEHEKVIKSSAEELERLNTQYAKMPSDYLKVIKSINTEKAKTAKSSKQLNEAEKETKRLEEAVLRQRERLKQATSENAKELTKLREETNRVNREQRQNAKETSKNVSEYKKLDLALTRTRNAAKEVGAEMFRLERTGRKNTEEYRKLEAEFKKLSRATNILDRGIKDIDGSLGQHQRKVGDYEIATDRLHPALGRVNQQLGVMGLSLDTLSGQGGFKAAQAALANFGRATLAFLLSPVGLAIVAVGSLFALIKGNKQTVIDFNAGLTNVGKTTGISGDELSQLGEEIVGLSRKLKVVGTPALLEYATVAGQLGVKGTENILAFTEALVKLETASNISGEEGAANIARLLTLTDGGVQNVGDFADEIVRLGNNFAATENEILGNATAIGQNVAQYKFGRRDVLAFATATKAVGVEAELTGSTLGRTLGLMENALRTGENVEVLTRLTGKSLGELQNIFQQDSAQALQLLVKGLNDVSQAGGSVNEQLQAIGISSIRDQRVIGSLATKGYGVLEAAINDVNAASGALDEEFEAASNNLENRLSKFGVAWDNLILTIEDGEGVFSQFFATLSESGAWVLDSITNRFKDFNNIMNSGESFVVKYASAVENMIPPLKWINQLRGRDNETMAENNRLRQEGVEKLKAEWKATGDLVTVAKDLNDEYFDIAKNLEDIVGIGQAATKQKDKETDATKRLLRGTAAWINEQISLLSKTRDETALTAKETQLYNNEIAKLEEQLKELTKTWETVNAGIKTNAAVTKEATIKVSMMNEELLTQEQRQAQLNNLAMQIRETYASTISLLGGEMGALSNEFATLIIGFTEGFDKFGDKFDQAAAIAQAAGGIIISSLRAVANAQNVVFENQLRNLETQRNIEIEYAGESAAARGQIEERYAEKKARIMEEQAKAARQNAIFESIINTAVAVTKALPNPILAAIVAALGAAQTIAIAAAPLPQFKDGVRNFEGGQAIVGDGGRREPITDKSGNLIGISPAKSTLVDLPKGANVYKSEADFYRELNGVLGQNGIAPSINVSAGGLTKDDVYQAMKKAIGSNKGDTVIMDKKGIKTYLVNENTRVQSLNNRVIAKGRKI